MPPFRLGCYLFGTLFMVAGWFPSKGHHHMTFHQEIAASAPNPNRSEQFRLKALLSEQRARESTDQRSKYDWEELAIEWHMMANLAAGENGEISQIEVT
jgi:hypothetical protein